MIKEQLSRDTSIETKKIKNNDHRPKKKKSRHGRYGQLITSKEVTNNLMIHDGPNL